MKQTMRTRTTNRVARERCRLGIESHEDAVQTSLEMLVFFKYNEKILNTWHKREMYKYTHPEIKRKDRKSLSNYGHKYMDAMAISQRYRLEGVGLEAFDGGDDE